MDQPSPVTQPAASALAVTGVYYDIVVETVAAARLGSHAVGGSGALLAIVPTTVTERMYNGEHCVTPALQFVFGMTTDAVLAEARAAHEAAVSDAYAATTAKERAEQQVAELRAQIDHLTKQVAAESELAKMLRRDLAEGSAARAEVIARFRRLEADLAKCRTYFGAKAFDEATKAAP